MNTYNIYYNKGMGRLQIRGNNPLEAFKKVYPKIEIEQTIDIDHAEFIIELVDGKKVSKKGYNRVRKTNELMIIFESGWLYYKTTASTARLGLQDFEKTCEMNGINLDNMDIYEVKLRDSEYNDIDRLICRK